MVEEDEINFFNLDLRALKNWLVQNCNSSGSNSFSILEYFEAVESNANSNGSVFKTGDLKKIFLQKESLTLEKLTQM